MLRLILLRLITSAVSLLLAAAFVFFMMQLSSTDPVILKLGDGADPAMVRQVTAELGLDRPVVVQFVDWLARAVQGDLGISYFTDRPVAQMIADRIPVTLSLTFSATIIAVVVGIAMGFAAGLHPDGWVDRVVTSIASLLLAVPSFWLALMLVLLFAVNFRILPVAGYTPIEQSFWGWLASLVLPAFALSVHGIAVIARHMRGVVIDVMNSSFIEALRARGVPRERAVRQYVLKNALPACLPIIGVQVAIIMATSAVMEKVFVLPGIGTLLVGAVISSDLPLLQGAIVLIAAFIILVNLLVDIGLGLLDPRVRPQ